MQPLARSTAKVLTIVCICTSVSAQGHLNDSANSDLSQLFAGRVGELFIGMAPAEIEKRLKRSLALQFAGEGRAGITLEKQTELQGIQLRTFMGTPVESVDVFFTERKGALRIDFISVGVPCQEVTLLQARMKVLPHASAHDPAQASGSASAKQPFRWGADREPRCRVWLSEA
jgi:hypothetical protein